MKTTKKPEHVSPINALSLDLCLIVSMPGHADIGLKGRAEWHEDCLFLWGSVWMLSGENGRRIRHTFALREFYAGF